MKKLSLWLVTLLLITSTIISFAFNGCAPAKVEEETSPAEEEPAAEAAEEITERELTVIFFTLQTADPCNMQRVKGMEDYFKKVGVNFEVSSADLSVDKQIADIETYISKKVDAILLQPMDTVALGSVVVDANRAGIPVILVNGFVESCEYYAYIHADHYQTGVKPAEYLAKQMNEEGKVVYLHYPMLSSCWDREAGLDATFNHYPDIEVVDRKLAWTSDVNIATVEDFLQAYPDLKGIWGVNDQVALDVLGVVEEKGKEDQVMIIGSGGIPDAVERIKAGSAFIATANENAELEGTLAADLAMKAIRGEEILLKEVIIPVDLITK